MSFLGEPQCVSTRMDIQPEKKNSNHIKVDEGYKNVGNWNITSKDTFAWVPVDPFFTPYHFLDVTSAAHAEFFSGNFLMPNITKVQLFSLKATGEFINAPYNRSVITTHSICYIYWTTPFPPKQLYHCRLQYYHQTDWVDINRGQEMYRNGEVERWSVIHSLFMDF